MTYANGLEGSKLYPTLIKKSMTYVLDQLADHVMQLYRTPFNHVGGLRRPQKARSSPVLLWMRSNGLFLISRSIGLPPSHP